MTRKHFTLHLSLCEANKALAANPQTPKEGENEFLATLLVGDNTFLGFFISTDELAKAAASMENQPVNIDHSPLVEDEVGFVRQPAMFGKALRGILTLNPKTTKFAVALAYIQNRIAAGKAPEVSVGFFTDIEEDEDGQLIARNIEFDHLALVTRGACSPEAGCGVGLSAVCAHGAAFNEPCKLCDHQEKTIVTLTDNAGSAPAPTTNAAPSPEPAKAASCGCEGKSLRAEIETLKTEKATLEQRLKDERERLKLCSEAEALGAPVEDADTPACLQKKIALAKAVAAKIAAQNPETATRHTKPNVSGGNSIDAEVRKLAQLAGLPVIDF